MVLNKLQSAAPSGRLNILGNGVLDVKSFTHIGTKTAKNPPIIATGSKV